MRHHRAWQGENPNADPFVPAEFNDAGSHVVMRSSFVFPISDILQRNDLTAM